MLGENRSTGQECFTCAERAARACDLRFETDEVIAEIWLCEDCIEGFDAVDWSEVELSDYL